MAAKVGAGLWAQYPAENPFDRLSVFDKLKDRIVPFILGHFELSDAEREFLSFAQSSDSPSLERFSGSGAEMMPHPFLIRSPAVSSSKLPAEDITSTH